MMPNPLSPRIVSDFVSELAEHGAEWFARTHTCPVIIGGALDEYPDSGFETVFSDTGSIPPQRHRAFADPPLVQELLRATVFPIRKRPGGPFANQIGIGRARNTDVCILRAEISKYHAYISQSTDGGYTITDAESANGTSVDGVSLAPLETRELLDGCVVRLGPHPFRFRLPHSFLAVVRTAGGSA